jgi:hypothetical protein
MKDSSYVFDDNGVIKKFPEGRIEANDLLKQTLLFNTTQEMNSERGVLLLSLSGWRIKDELT